MAQKSDHDRISAKAHELWEADGRPHGRDQDHWNQAREIIAIEDSQKSTLLPRKRGAKAPVENAGPALRNLADMPNLTDQGENLLTSTDREPDLVATPAGKRNRMPKAEVPTSDQPGMPKARDASKPAGTKTAAKPAKSAATTKPAAAVKNGGSPAKPASAKVAKPEKAKVETANSETTKPMLASKSSD